MLNRRDFLIAGTLAAAGLGMPLRRAQDAADARRPVRSVPLIHISDLYHPPQDPDDHIDLATLAALKELDLRGVILDVSRQFLEAAPAGFDITRDPGFVPVAQLAYLLGRSIPVAAGPALPLNTPMDDARDRPLKEQAGIHLLLDLLHGSSDPAVISIVGSARVLTAAFNRDPDFVRKKVAAVLLNAGSTGGTKREWNVGLDPSAYIGLWRSGLPVHWYPCATETGAFNQDDEHGTYWKSTHRELFGHLPAPLRSWFCYALKGDSRGDIIRALAEDPPADVWEGILNQSRNLWATASLVMAAGRVLAQTSEGWRFIPTQSAAPGTVWPWRLDPIRATVTDTSDVEWHEAKVPGNAKLFGRQRGSGFGPAMAEALSALLGSIPV